MQWGKPQYEIAVKINKKLKKNQEELYTERFHKKIKNYELQRKQPLHPSTRILLTPSLRIWAFKPEVL